MNKNYQKQIESWFEGKEMPMLKDIARLVAYPSVKGDPAENMPFGENVALCLADALRICDGYGFHTENIDNYVGTVDMNDKETELHILGHLDVVPPGDGWTVTDPYMARLVEGDVYGRGTSDDKGPMIAALYGMRAVKELGIPLKKNVKLIFGTDEESGMDDTKYYYSKYPYAPYTMSPDADYPVINIEKGHYHPTFHKKWDVTEVLPRVTEMHGSDRVNVVPGKATATIAGMAALEIAQIAVEVAKQTKVEFSMEENSRGTVITCEGIRAHASLPHMGNNAVTGMIALLNALPLAECESTTFFRHLGELFPHGDNGGNALGIAQKDEISGELTLAFSIIEVSESGADCQFDARTPICTTEENCKAVAEKKFADCGIECSGDIWAPHYVEADSPFVKILLDCYEGYTGEKGECIAIGGGTYVHDIPGGVAFGACMPGYEANMHGADEKMSVEDLMLTAEMYAQVIVELCAE